MTGLETKLRALRDGGRKLVVPYLMAATTPGWTEYLLAAEAGGADAIEVGIPFSDPSMDGVVIQRAGELALGRGANPFGILAELRGISLGIPMLVMTYYNLFYRAGLDRMAGMLAEAGVEGVILPDLPLEEAGPWIEAASPGIATVQLISPITEGERLARVVAASEGFVYGVGLMGITGERLKLAETATGVARRIKAVSDKVVCVGVGVSSPEQAAEVVAAGSDGVVVGSALVRRVLEGARPQVIEEFVGGLRSAVDRG